MALAKVPPKVFTENNVKLSVIGCSPSSRIVSFAADTAFDANLIYSNPKLKVYKALDLVEAKNFGEIKGKGEKAKESYSGIIKGMAWSIYKSLRHKSGNVYQLGGCYVVDQEKNILFKKIDTSSEDHVGVEELLKLAGVQNN